MSTQLDHLSNKSQELLALGQLARIQPSSAHLLHSLPSLDPSTTIHSAGRVNLAGPVEDDDAVAIAAASVEALMKQRLSQRNLILVAIPAVTTMDAVADATMVHHHMRSLALALELHSTCLA